ncbi:hypothetical protein M406DRAFT_332067 [Cryphonectria parasitica EP155]|uniref:Uncharacterized protein n=1 Tax=Cryphonectria parasitica (strain ATCC 38755 / EP155) TaxID=660469 RepID=A0A9P4XZ80_CRYP1|nr:uncharacterized protein M406DRAFT_332067 [Cryphonectria parasitica EP155]KAF3763598.1 hypothetical protein M406DRAFT_332067 [Cryphonectria parasitica EP155]
MAGIIPQDERFDYDFLQVFSAGRYGGSDRVEAQVEARVGSTPDSKLTKSQRVGIRDRLFAAASYDRSADFYLHGKPEDPHINALWERQTACFDRAQAIAQGDSEIPIIYFSAAGSGPKRTLLLGNGFGGAQEELLHWNGFAALERGFNIITYEGLSLCARRRLRTPPRRLAAIVACDGLWNFGVVYLPRTPFEAVELYRSGHRAEFDGTFNKIATSSRIPNAMQWSLDQTLWSFCMKSASEFFDRVASFTLEGVIGGVRCPIFIGDAEADCSKVSRSR